MKNEVSSDEVSKKLNVLISLLLKVVANERQLNFEGRRKRGTGGIVRYLSDMGLSSSDIAAITGAPLSSVRTLLTPKRRK